MEIEKLYQDRFKNKKQERDIIWQILCKYYFQRFIKPNDVVLDLGAGYCEFINNIICGEKFAIDINSEINSFASKTTKCIVADCVNLKMFSNNYFDVIFISNFLEHLPSKKHLLDMLIEVKRVLKNKSSVLILSPNILYVKEHYWDFLDHNIPLTHLAIKELLEMNGFQVIKMESKFLPYTMLSHIPKKRWIIKTYLKMTFLWKIFGKQMFIIGMKNV